MATMTTSSDSPATTQRVSRVRQMLIGAAAFDFVGGIFCFAASGPLTRWLSIPRGSAYVTGAMFLMAAVTGALTLRRDPLRVGWIVAANEVFAVWCLLMLGLDDPNALGVALLAVASLSSAGTGLVELQLGRRGSAR